MTALFKFYAKLIVVAALAITVMSAQSAVLVSINHVRRLAVQYMPPGDDLTATHYITGESADGWCTIRVNLLPTEKKGYDYVVTGGKGLRGVEVWFGVTDEVKLYRSVEGAARACEAAHIWREKQKKMRMEWTR